MSTIIKNRQKNNLDTQEAYKCSKCKDKTLILVDDEALFCECRALRESESILRKSGISEEFSKKTFENFNYEKNSVTVELYTLAKVYTNYFKERENQRRNSVLFMGVPGCGKTHLSLAIANDFIKKGIGVVYMNYREDITIIKQNILDSNIYNKYLNKYKNARVLLIDDLFKGSITQSDINIVFEIINYRYLNSLPMVISTEKMQEELLDYDEGTMSRVIEMSRGHMVEIVGREYNYRLSC